MFMSANAVVGPGRAGWISIGKGAAMLGVSIPVIDVLIRDRKLTVRKVGKWRRLSVAEVEQLDRDATRGRVEIPAP
jgi:hypothetical protein